MEAESKDRGVGRIPVDSMGIRANQLLSSAAESSKNPATRARVETDRYKALHWNLSSLEPLLQSNEVKRVYCASVPQASRLSQTSLYIED